jgi:hypothetical protein
VFLPDEALLDYRLHGANTILSGEIRNHLEAGFHAACGAGPAHGGELARPLARLHLTDRYLRRRKAPIVTMRSLQAQDHERQAAQAAERHDELAQANQWYEGQLREHRMVQAEREQAVRLSRRARKPGSRPAPAAARRARSPAGRRPWTTSRTLEPSPTAAAV